jgi:hypothetical protein
MFNTFKSSFEEMYRKSTVDSIKSIVLANIENQKKLKKIRSGMSHVEYLKEYATVRFSSARQMGHTQAAIELHDFIKSKKTLLLTFKNDQVKQLYKRFVDNNKSKILKRNTYYSVLLNNSSFVLFGTHYSSESLRNSFLGTELQLCVVDMSQFLNKSEDVIYEHFSCCSLNVEFPVILFLQ